MNIKNKITKTHPRIYYPFIYGFSILVVSIFFGAFLIIRPINVFAKIPFHNPHDSCNTVNINYASTGPSCPMFSTSNGGYCQNPAGNPTNPNINSQTLTVTLSSNDGRAHNVSYWTANNFCTNGYLSNDAGYCSCTSNPIYQNKIVKVLPNKSVSISITRSPTVGSYCGSYQLDFSVTAIDGNTSCNNGNSNNNVGGSLVCETGIKCTVYSISGNIFDDLNKNGIQDVGEYNYTVTPDIAISPNKGTVTRNINGSYSISNLPQGTYTISYINLPLGYYMTSPLNGPPPSFSVTVGPQCSTNGAPGAMCNADNITNLNFGISALHPWIQSTCGDIRDDNGITNLEPAGQLAITTNASCTNPGIMFTGDTNANYGQGQASSSRQTVGGFAYPEVFSTTSTLDTSYTSLLTKAQAAGITPTNLASYCNLSNCTIPWNLPHGIYIANRDLTLSTSTYNVFNSANYIILVNGNLTLNGSIHVPVGSTLLFSATKNIVVDSNVGLPPNNPNPQLDGWYIAGQNFIVNSRGNCNDLRLGIAGTVVVNAMGSGGTFQNNRDLCGNDSTDPTVSFSQRLDMILNAPQFLKQQQTISQEIAP